MHHVIPDDHDKSAALLARSFDGDPQMRFLFPDPATRVADLTDFFSTILGAGVRRGHTYTIPGRAVSLWAPPAVTALTDDEAGPIVELIAGRYGAEGIARLVALSEAMATHHPTDPHMYLFIVGVEPSLQGQGIGLAILGPTLAHCDVVGASAYLESSNPRNISFYERLGFEVRSEFYPEGGPLFTGMWRDPLRA